jgi:hypothetical protein
VSNDRDEPVELSVKNACCSAGKTGFDRCKRRSGWAGMSEVQQELTVRRSWHRIGLNLGMTAALNLTVMHECHENVNSNDRLALIV